MSENQELVHCLNWLPYRGGGVVGGWTQDINTFYGGGRVSVRMIIKLVKKTLKVV
jgi:hypothetical protein